MATSPASGGLLTVAEFIALPEPEDGSRLELLHGEVIVTPPPSPRHGVLISRLDGALGSFIRGHMLGELFTTSSFTLDPEARLVVEPDLAFVPAAQLAPDVFERSSFIGSPTLAVEVISPSEQVGDALRKVRHYLDAGTERVWAVLPVDGQVLVYRHDGHPSIHTADDTLASDHAGFEVEGFELPLRDLFA